MMIVIFLGFWQAYQARIDLVASQRAGCERGKLDRAANAEGWRTAQVARAASAAENKSISIEAVNKLIRQPVSPGDGFDLIAARRYHKITTELTKRSRINCAEAFPDATLIH